MTQETRQIETFSLLWPNGKIQDDAPNRQRWGDRAIADLEIEQLADYLCPDYLQKSTILSFLLALTTDAEVIRYRQAIFDDCARIPEVGCVLSELQPHLSEMERLGGPVPQGRTPLHKTIYRLGELELYVRCIDTLATVLTANRLQLHSEGLLQLADFAIGIKSQTAFQRMEKELPALRARFDSVASITIGVNLDDSFQPVEATLLGFQAKPFREGTFLGKLFGKGSPEDQEGIAPLHSVPFKTIRGHNFEVQSIERQDPLLYPLFRDLDRVLKEVTKPVAQALTAYVQISSQPLSMLGDEIIFYQNGMRMAERLQKSNLPICRPEVTPLEERVCQVEGLYNLHLALRKMDEDSQKNLSEEVITSDANFGDAGRIFILTGPNRGGKTTYTQALGLAQVLFQAGLFVPGKKARMSPVDGIYTHFPVEERPALDAGRLGEEAARIGDIFRHITRYSLVLLNESFSTTSPGEGLYLARDVVRAMRQLGTRALFATHLHELGNVDIINQDTPGDSLVASLVAGSIGGEPEAHKTNAPDAKRTYRIEAGPPQGISHARDIARKYGIELHQLMKSLLDRKEM